MGLFSHAQKWHCFGLLYLQHSSTNFDNILCTIRSYYYVQYANNYLSTSHFCVISVRQRDQCGRRVICTARTTVDQPVTHSDCNNLLTLLTFWTFSGKLSDSMPSIVAFQLKQIFNQNLIFFSKWHVY